jgi:hypothetical protein
MLLWVSTPYKLNILLDHGGNRTGDLCFAGPMLCQLNYEFKSVQVGDISELFENIFCCDLTNCTACAVHVGIHSSRISWNTYTIIMIMRPIGYADNEWTRLSSEISHFPLRVHVMLITSWTVIDLQLENAVHGWFQL